MDDPTKPRRPTWQVLFPWPRNGGSRSADEKHEPGRPIPLTAIVYIMIAALCITFYLSAPPFHGILSPNDIGPTRYPRALALACLALIIIETVVARRRWVWAPLRDLWLISCMGIYLVGAVWLTGLAGFYVVLPVALFAGLWLLGSRALVANLVYSIALTAFVWLVFQYALGIPIAHMAG